MEKQKTMSNDLYQKILSDTRITLASKIIFRELWEFSDENWELTLKNRELMALTGYSERTISRNIRLLAKYGYVLRNTTPDEIESLSWKRKIKIIKKEG